MGSRSLIATAAAFMGAAVLLCAGCDRQASQPQADTPVPVRVDEYHGILGVVSQVPVPGQPMTEFKIHHEHIPTFKTKDGEISVAADGVPGMKAMIMPFPRGEGVSIDELSVGDKVRFSFRVNWGGSPPWELTAIETIDPATEISYENKPAEPDSPSDP